MNPAVTVIVPAYNAARSLPACLQALRCQRGFESGRELELIVVDDGSTDETGRLAELAGAWVLRQPNAGPAAARNRGAQAAHGALLAFTDADCIPAPDWLERLTAPFADPQVAAAKGVYSCAETNLVARFVQCEYEDKYARLMRRETIDFIDTYSACYRREVFLQNGGFDPIFPRPSVEDQELSFRLSRKGYRMVFVPDAAVQHRHDLSLVEYARRKFGIGYWKAWLINWLPEKAFGDAHTPPEQRWQMLLAALVPVLAVLAGFLPGAGTAAAVAAGLFLISALRLAGFILRRDPPVLWVALPAILLRALALDAGALSGFFFRPRGVRLPRLGYSMAERAAKRALDLAVSLPALVLSAPLLAVLSLAVRLDSPGPAFFSQIRTGEGGRPFRMWKLRTMQANAQDSPVEKSPRDPRVTRLGRFLRRWSLDELPQFWNVFRGEMSLVGPRPEEIRVSATYNDRQRLRLAVKPGLTGPMQIHGRAELTLDERLDFELEYLQHYSFWRDIIILLRSIPAILSGRGAY